MTAFTSFPTPIQWASLLNRTSLSQTLWSWTYVPKVWMCFFVPNRVSPHAYQFWEASCLYSIFYFLCWLFLCFGLLWCGFGKGWGGSLGAGWVALQLYSHFFFLFFIFIPTFVESAFLYSAGDTICTTSGSWQSRLEHVVWAQPVSVPVRTLNLELSEQKHLNGYNSLIVWQQWSQQCSFTSGPVLLTPDDSNVF